MTIKEIEEQSGLERANIRFYEKEGLVFPVRQENGYRDFSEEDLRVLLRIKLLRSLHISLEEIKGLKNGQETLVHVLERQTVQLELQAGERLDAREVCILMQRDGADFADFDAEKYLEELRQIAERKGEFEKQEIFGDKEDGSFLEQDVDAPFYPWRRFFGRMFDFVFSVWFWHLLLGAIFRANLLFWNLELKNDGIDLAAGMLLMLVTEPVFLHMFGTTPGKFLVGIFVEHSTGRKLTYEEALGRTWSVLLLGLGLFVPVVHWFCLWKSYGRYRKQALLPWEKKDVEVYLFREGSWIRWAVCAVAFALLVPANAALVLGQFVPPNTGELTVEEYAENVNYYAEYFRMFTEGKFFLVKPWSYSEQKYYNTTKKCMEIYMNPQGQWEKKSPWNWTVPEDANATALLEYVLHPEYAYRLDETGNISELSLSLEFRSEEDFLAPTYDVYKLLAALGYVGARVSPLRVGMLLRELEWRDGQNYSIELSGICLESEYVLYGFGGSPYGPYFMPDREILGTRYDENSYRMEFKIKSEK